MLNRGNKPNFVMIQGMLRSTKHTNIAYLESKPNFIMIQGMLC